MTEKKEKDVKQIPASQLFAAAHKVSQKIEKKPLAISSGRFIVGLEYHHYTGDVIVYGTDLTGLRWFAPLYLILMDESNFNAIMDSINVEEDV